MEAGIVHIGAKVSSDTPSRSSMLSMLSQT